MQRWYQQEQETVSPVPTVTAATTTVPADRRYDRATMQKAVEIASRMQADHEVMLSTQGMESIVTDAGLAQIQKPANARKRLRRRLSRRTGFLIFGPPAIYSVLFTGIGMLLMAQHSGMDLLTMIFFMILPALITLFSAIRLRRVVQGTIAGLLMGMGLILATLVASIPTNNLPSVNEFWVVFACFAISGAVLGTVSTYLGRNLPHWIADKD